MHFRQTRNSRPVLFQTLNQGIYKVYCNVYPTAFDVVASSCGRQESGSSYTKMGRRYDIIRQRMPVSELLHTSYSPDLSPRYFFLFPRLQRALKDHRYADNRVIQMAVTKQLCSIPVLSTIASKTPRNTGSGTFMQ